MRPGLGRSPQEVGWLGRPTWSHAYPSGIQRCESYLAMHIMLDAHKELRKLPQAPDRFVQELSLVFAKTGHYLFRVASEVRRPSDSSKPSAGSSS